MLLVLLSPDIQKRPDHSHRSIADFSKIETSRDNTYLLSNFCDEYQFISVTQSCSTTCDPTDRSIPGFPVYHQLPELAQMHVH